MNIELDSHWEILAEAIQTVLCKTGKMMRMKNSKSRLGVTVSIRKL